MSLATALPKVRKVKPASDAELLLLIEEVVFNDGKGAGITEEELLEGLRDTLKRLGFRPVQDDRILRLVNSNTSRDKTFLRFYKADGPIALTRSVRPIIDTISNETADGDEPLALASLMENIHHYTGVGTYQIDYHEDVIVPLLVITEMVDRGYLKMDSSMNLRLTPALIYDDYMVKQEPFEVEVTDHTPAPPLKLKRPTAAESWDGGKRPRLYYDRRL